MANESTEDEYREIAPDGQLWVCGACGKSGKDRVKVGDESCFLNAILCYERKNEQGRWVAVPGAKR